LVFIQKLLYLLLTYLYKDGRERSVSDFLKIIKEELGGWPLLDNQPNKFSIIQLLSRLHFFYRVDFNNRDNENEYLFNIAIGQDPLNKTQKLITLRQPTFIKSSKIYSTDSKIYDLFKLYLTKVFSYMNPQNENKEFETDVKQIYDLIKKFSSIHIENASSKDDDFDYKRLSLKQLHTELNNVYFQEVFIYNAKILKIYNI
jgi:predicted metalloendopeptidase